MLSTYQNRLEKCRAQMRSFGIGCLILTPGASMQYLSGFSEEAHERLLCLVIPVDGESIFITPSLNAEQVALNDGGISDIRQWTDNQGYDNLLADVILHNANAGKVAVDDSLPARFLLKIIATIDPKNVVTSGDLISSLRSVKDAAELDALRRAAKLTDLAFLAALRECRVGQTETKLAEILRKFVTDFGAELSFETIVAVGPNSALPHHHTGDTVIKDGDIVLFDLGAKVDGYCGDITRVVCVGEPTDRQRYVYNVVYKAHEAAVKKAAPGIPAQHVDSAARLIIEDYGFGKEFIHRTGHGIGLEPHETPNIVLGNLHKLIQGNCFSIEPGIYLPGEFGVRLENIATVTADHVEILNAPISPKLLPVDKLLSFYEIV